MGESKDVLVERVETVMGWPLMVVEGGTEPLIEDEELGRRLGYERPGDVRKLIGRIFNQNEVIATVSQTSSSGGRPARISLLTEAQALEVCVCSQTERARAIRREVIEVFLAIRHGRAAPQRAPADPWAAISALAGGTLELRTAVGEASAKADSAHARADHAVKLAEQAVNLAGSRSLIEEVIRSTPPGTSSATPDGAWSAKPPEGYKSMRALARDFALPSDGVGAGFVGRVARALGIYDDPEAVSHQDVVIGGRARRAHVTYGPTAIARLAPALRHAHARMAAHGYHVVHGVMQPRGGGVVRSKPFVIGEMLAAAASGADGVRAQTSIPGIDDRRAG